MIHLRPWLHQNAIMAPQNGLQKSKIGSTFFESRNPLIFMGNLR